MKAPVRRSPDGRALVLIGVFLAGGIAAWVAARPSFSGPPVSTSPVKLDAEHVARGALLYAANCASCHGAQGEGEANWKSPNPDGTYPAPPHDSSGHTWHHADRLLLEIIRDGGARYETATFKRRMPAWRERLTDDEIRAVLEYLKSLWGMEERRLQAEASARDPEPDVTR